MVNSRTKNGAISYMCRKCCTERNKKYRSTEKGRENIFSAVYRSVKKYPEKQRARVTLNNSIKKGELNRPEFCSICLTHKKIEAHHKDYSKPLDVVWVCRPCHKVLDRELKSNTM